MVRSEARTTAKRGPQPPTEHLYDIIQYFVFRNPKYDIIVRVVDIRRRFRTYHICSNFMTTWLIVAHLLYPAHEFYIVLRKNQKSRSPSSKFGPAPPGQPFYRFVHKTSCLKSSLKPARSWASLIVGFMDDGGRSPQLRCAQQAAQGWSAGPPRKGCCYAAQ